MAPPNSACPTEPMIEPRVNPVVARAGRFVLVLGGQGPGGNLVSAELYDPQTDRFEPVEVPARLAAAGRFSGAVATALMDGRVALTGGPTGSYSVFDPQTKRFGPPIVLEPRFFHGAVALGGDALLVAGGCRGATVAGVCDGESARPPFRLAVDSDEQDVLTPLERDHVQPTLLLDPGLAAGLGASAGRGPSVLAVGAVTAQGLPAATDRIDLATGAATALPGTGATATVLDSGAVLTGFAAAGLGATRDIAVITPHLAVRPAILGPTMAEASMTLLEDGSVLALGQSASSTPMAQLYRPGLDRWLPVTLPPAVTSLGQHRALRLDDGSVLVLGAGTASAPAATAWRFRPSLVGPFTSSAIVVPNAEQSAELTPSDVDAVTRTDERFELGGTRSGLGAWLIAGGPRLVEGRLTAVFRPVIALGEQEGLAVITHFQSAASLVSTQIVPGAQVTVQHHVGAQVTVLCRGQVAPALPATPVTVTFTLRAGALTVRVADVEVVACTVAELPRGGWGVAVIGVATRLGIDTLTVER